MKTVLLIILTIISSVVTAGTSRLEFRLRLEKPLAKDSNSCRVTLSVINEDGVSCFRSELVLGNDEECDFYYVIKGKYVESEPWYGRGHKLISQANALNLLNLPELPDACK